MLPGFVDAHTHVPFAGSRAAEYGERLAGVSYGEILARGGGINVTVAATRQASEEELARLCPARYDSMLRHGTTTAEVKSGYGLTAADEAKQLRAAAVAHPLRRELTFLGAHFVPPEYEGRADDYIHLVCDEMIPACAPLARWCDVFCDEGAFTVEQSRRVLEAGAGRRPRPAHPRRRAGALRRARCSPPSSAAPRPTTSSTPRGRRSRR